tara:strand:+ start:25676 stop:26311 length:636 start_codon:yes stop_codon:yes gene_type:complete
MSYQSLVPQLKNFYVAPSVSSQHISAVYLIDYAAGKLFYAAWQFGRQRQVISSISSATTLAGMAHDSLPSLESGRYLQLVQVNYAGSATDLDLRTYVYNELINDIKTDFCNINFFVGGHRGVAKAIWQSCQALATYPIKQQLPQVVIEQAVSKMDECFGAVSCCFPPLRSVQHFFHQQYYRSGAELHHANDYATARALFMRYLFEQSRCFS